MGIFGQKWTLIFFRFDENPLGNYAEVWATMGSARSCILHSIFRFNLFGLFFTSLGRNQNNFPWQVPTSLITCNKNTT